MKILCFCFLESETDLLWEVTEVDGGRDMNSSSRRGDKRDVTEEVREIAGVLNPTACLHLGDFILFTVDTRHYPQYDL